MTQLRRKVFMQEIDVSKMSEDVREILEFLGNEMYLGIKGGYAKKVLREFLGQTSKKIHYPEMEMDLDIILTFAGTLAKNIDMLDSRVVALKQKLSGTIILSPADVEPVKGNLGDEKTLKKILESRDLTINEVVLVPDNGKWFLYYTDKCYRDTLQGVGILAANGKRTTRVDCGRTVAAPAGIARLLRFLIEGKVKKIYLPRWWIDFETGLGSYGLVLCRRYRGNPFFERRMMAYLKKLGLTNLDTKDFEQYMRVEEIAHYDRTGEEFLYNDNRSFKEIHKASVKGRKQGEAGRQGRKEERDNCLHKATKVFTCEHCHENCTIERCADCTAFEITRRGTTRVINPVDLQCNLNFRRATVDWDKSGFFPTRS